MDTVLTGLQLFLTIENALAVIVGMSLGITIGAIPGLSSTMGIALVLPFTYAMTPISAILLVVGIYKGGMFAGSISAILVRTPGTPGNICTLLDGWPLTQNGKSRKALDISLYSSVCADFISNIALISFAALIASFALRFGPPEYFWLMAFSLTVVTAVSGNSLSKGMIAATMGLLLSTVGLDLVYGGSRFTFGILELTGGVNLVPLLIGLFAIPEIVNYYIKPEKDMDGESRAGSALTFSEFRRCFPTILRSSGIGVGIGAIPGVGSTAAAFLSYTVAKRRSKTPQNFGKGEIEGVAAAEAGNNSVAGATLIPLLALGIPGDVVTAVMVGAFLIHGLSIGPALFQTQGEIIYAIFFGIMLSSLAMLVLGMLSMRYFSRISDVPKRILMPSLLIFCVFGTYAINNNHFDLLIMILAGVAGFSMMRLDVPVAPFLIAFVLGPMFEDNFRRSMLLASDGIMIFFRSPICWVFMILTGLLLYYSLSGVRMERLRVGR